MATPRARSGATHRNGDEASSARTMIVTNCFPGDSNDKLKWIQHELYGLSLKHLVNFAELRYLSAVRLVGVETELAKRLRSKDSFDHRVLQDAHDKIAAHYRYKHDSGGQMPLPMDGLSYEGRLKRDWLMFSLDEAKRLAGIDHIARAILTSVAYQNTPKGYQAEDDLMAALKEEYGDFDAVQPEANQGELL